MDGTHLAFLLFTLLKLIVDFLKKEKTEIYSAFLYGYFNERMR